MQNVSPIKGTILLLPPQKIPLIDIATAVEGVTRRMENEEVASNLRDNISSILTGLGLHAPTFIKISSFPRKQ